MMELYFSKVIEILTCNFTTIGLCHRVFFVKCLKVFRKSFLWNGQLPLEVVSENILKNSCSEKIFNLSS